MYTAKCIEILTFPHTLTTDWGSTGGGYPFAGFHDSGKWGARFSPSHSVFSFPIETSPEKNRGDTPPVTIHQQLQCGGGCEMTGCERSFSHEFFQCFFSC